MAALPWPAAPRYDAPMATPRGSDESFASLFEQTAGAQARQRRYHTGESVEVTIVAVARDAVFADLGGKQEGVFERVELSDADGKVRVEVGSRVTAVVDSVDGATGQVRLRPVVIRAEGGDVGVTRAGSGEGAAAAVLVEGARVKGKVTGVERYGVFVQIAGTQGRSGRGLVPGPETGTPRGADLKKHFAAGQDVEAKILNIDETGKIRLSIAALGADDERGLYEAFKSSQGTAGAPAEGPAQPAQKKEKPAPRGFGTLADLLPRVAGAPPSSTKSPGVAAAGPKGAPSRKVVQEASAASRSAATRGGVPKKR
jgi:small subunit ribosomal protein S1